MKRLRPINTTKKNNGLISLYIKEILSFNKAHNIVGRSSEDQIINEDIEDCETILDHIPKNQSILDIGSGAGLPGLVIAIYQPWNTVTLSEKNQKKAYFIKKTIRSLGLKNAYLLNEAIHPGRNKDKKFDVITARALAKTHKIVEISEHHLKESGKYLLMKGLAEKINEELVELDNEKYSYTIHKKELKNFNRNILEINRK